MPGGPRIPICPIMPGGPGRPGGPGGPGQSIFIFLGLFVGLFGRFVVMGDGVVVIAGKSCVLFSFVNYAYYFEVKETSF